MPCHHQTTLLQLPWHDLALDPEYTGTGNGDRDKWQENKKEEHRHFQKVLLMQQFCKGTYGLCAHCVTSPLPMCLQKTAATLATDNSVAAANSHLWKPWNINAWPHDLTDILILSLDLINCKKQGNKNDWWEEQDLHVCTSSSQWNCSSWTDNYEL